MTATPPEAAYQGVLFDLDGTLYGAGLCHRPQSPRSANWSLWLRR